METQVIIYNGDGLTNVTCSKSCQLRVVTPDRQVSNRVAYNVGCFYWLSPILRLGVWLAIFNLDLDLSIPVGVGGVTVHWSQQYKYMMYDTSMPAACCDRRQR